MKLLIVTQVIDTEHPVLGFFHRWVEEFAKHCEQVHVVCLQAGKHSLPANVTIHSLGKEAGKGKFTYLWRFYKLIWTLRHEYDSVFVHMNQVYVILGAPFWRAVGKKVGLWYAHGATSFSLYVATLLTNLVFTSTQEGFRLKSNKIQIVGQGIDTKLFRPKHKRKNVILQLVTVGRISRSKNIETLLEACAKLKINAVPFHFSIIGSATTLIEELYAQEMRKLYHNLGLEEEVTWFGAVSQSALPAYLQTADIFIHDGTTNSLDKTLLEAALCGCVVLSSNPAYAGIIAPFCKESLYTPNNSAELAILIEKAQQLSQTSLDQIRHFIRENYSVDHLISGIVIKY